MCITFVAMYISHRLIAKPVETLGTELWSTLLTPLLQCVGPRSQKSEKRLQLETFPSLVPWQPKLSDRDFSCYKAITWQYHYVTNFAHSHSTHSSARSLGSWKATHTTNRLSRLLLALWKLWWLGYASDLSRRRICQFEGISAQSTLSCFVEACKTTSFHLLWFMTHMVFSQRSGSATDWRERRAPWVEW